MQAKKVRSHGRMTANIDDFSGDETQLSNHTEFKNSATRRSTKSKHQHKQHSPSKNQQTTVTLEWLSENYELIEGVCIPRCVLYTHYLDFCKKRKFSPAGPATFGKLIRQKFPKLTTRRLGTRGQSKYHYYGISIKESSLYYHSTYSGKASSRYSLTENGKQDKNSRSEIETRNTLPKFPSAADMILTDGLSAVKVDTFIIMYRTHCQRMLDSVMNANFSEVHKFLIHFWRGLPSHMSPVLQCDAVIDVIVVCDSLLYRILLDILMPSAIQDIPDSLTEEIQDFAVNFVISLKSCLEYVHQTLRNKKLQVAKNFSRILKRSMSFINLAQTARPVFLTYESMSGIMNEFRSLDMETILTQLSFLTECQQVDLSSFMMFLDEFENLLVKQAPIEAYNEWLDSIVQEYVFKDMSEECASLESLSKKSQSFLTNWAFVTSRVIQELTLNAAPTFGSFQLIVMMFEEYILFIIEKKMISLQDEGLKRDLSRHLKTSSKSNKETLDPFSQHTGEAIAGTVDQNDNCMQPTTNSVESTKSDTIHCQTQEGFPTVETYFNSGTDLRRVQNLNSGQSCFTPCSTMRQDLSQPNLFYHYDLTSNHGYLQPSSYYPVAAIVESQNLSNGAQSSATDQFFHHQVQGVNFTSTQAAHPYLQRNSIKSQQEPAHYYQDQIDGSYIKSQHQDFVIQSQPFIHSGLGYRSTYEIMNEQNQNHEDQMKNSNQSDDYPLYSQFKSPPVFQTSLPHKMSSSQMFDFHPKTVLPSIHQLSSQLLTGFYSSQ